MSSEEIRQLFLEFFKKKGHKIVPSSSLITDDPSVLFTTAGMQQFKSYYMGEKSPYGNNVVSIQKCFRTSDIDEVGDNSHLTFLEMMGNFSFGGYFKKETIEYAYEFVTKELGLKIDFVTIFGGDEEILEDGESEKIWKEIAPGLKIKKAGREDNFWGPTGDEGPCGPTTEIYVNGIEVWNLVFNEYYKDKNNKFTKLKVPGVDTGMGLERLLAVIKNVGNVFETDVFEPLILKIKEFAPELNQHALRILADHLRASVFLIADGIRPSNKEAGYVLRRILRRILAYTVKYDIHADLFVIAAEFVKEKFGEIYPEVEETKTILEIMDEEKQKFQEAIARGLKELEKYPEINGQDAFYLYETFGLPFELIKELAPEEAAKNLSKKDFESEFEKHQELSRTASAGMFKGGLADHSEQVIKYHTAAHLLLAALREVLGEHVTQKGSNITDERLRLDFSHPEKLTPEQIKQVEDMINQKISEDLPVKMEEMSLEQAKKQGAMGVFESKYGEKVRVYTIGDPSTGEGKVFSKEICGGPHVQSTGKLGRFKIIKEEASSSGVRRIKATLD